MIYRKIYVKIEAEKEQLEGTQRKNMHFLIEKVS